MYQQQHQQQQQEQHGYWVEYMQATWTQHDRPWKVYYGRGRQEVGAYATEAEALADADASNEFDARMQPAPGARLRQLEAEHKRLMAEVATVTKAPRMTPKQRQALEALAAVRMVSMHHNTARSLVRHGWVEGQRITEAGRAALHAVRAEEREKRESDARAARRKPERLNATNV